MWGGAALRGKKVLEKIEEFYGLGKKGKQGRRRLCTMGTPTWMSKAKLRAYNLWDGMSIKRSGMRGVTGGETVVEGVEGPAWPEDMVGTSHGRGARGVAARVSVT